MDGEGNPAGMLSIPDPVTAALWGTRLALDLLVMAGVEETADYLLESLPDAIGSDPAQLLPVLMSALRTIGATVGTMIDVLEDGPHPGTRRVLAEQAAVAWVRRRDLEEDKAVVACRKAFHEVEAAE